MGRDVFRAEACWTCHSPAARAQVTALGRRGPIRTRDWLTAHLFAPRLVSPGSPMPGSPQLFGGQPWADVGQVTWHIEKFDANGDGRVSFVSDARPTWKEDAQHVGRMSELDRAGLRAPPRSALQTRSGEELWPDAKGERAYVDQWVAGEEQGDALLSRRDARPVPGKAGTLLLTYLQALQAPSPLPTDDALGKPGVSSLLAMGGRVVPRRGADGVTRARLAAPRVLSPRIAREGAVLYGRHCASCHGTEGRGNGVTARFLDDPPTDLVNGHFKYRSSPLGEAPLLTDLYRTVRRGLPGTPMAGMRSATPDQVWAVVLHVRAFAKGRTPAASSVSVPPVPPLRLRNGDDRAMYARYLARGKAVFVAFECSRCHGTEGRGDGPDAIVEWSDGRLVRARDFKARDGRDHPRHRLRGGARPEDVWRTIMTGLDHEGMPGVHAAFDAARKAGKPVPVDKRLVQPLKDPLLFEVGVVASKDGPYEEVLETLYAGPSEKAGWRSFGDDWALVLYVLHLARTTREVSRGTMTWPKIEVVK